MAKWLVFSLVKWVVFITLAFLALFLMFKESADPTAENPWMFALAVLFVVSTLCGQFVVSLKLNLPPLLGMIIAGVAMRNLPYIGDRIGAVAEMQREASSTIFDLALALILAKSGLSLNVSDVLKQKWVITRLAVLPFLAEGFTIAGLAMLILEFPLQWALALGWLWAAVAPAVVIPPMLALTADGYGTNTGIVPASIASSVVDDVLAVVLYGVFKRQIHPCVNAVAMMCAADPWPAGLYLIPFELIVGGLAGAVIAVIVVTASSAFEGESPSLDSVRLVMLIAACNVTLFGIKELGYPGCASVATLIVAMGAGKGWGPAGKKRVSMPLSKIWSWAAEPILFGLVGVQVKFGADLTLSLVGIGIGMLALGLIARFLVAFLCMNGRGLNWKEKLFTALSQIPKATVQAALCAQLLMNVAEGEEERKWGAQVLVLCVIIILGTAPVGATLMIVAGPRMLTKDVKVEMTAEKLVRAPSLKENSNQETGPPTSFGDQTDTELGAAVEHIFGQATLAMLEEQYDASSFP